MSLPKDDRAAQPPASGGGDRLAELPAVPTDCLYYLISRASLIATAVLGTRLAATGPVRVKPAYLGVLMSLWEADGLRTATLGRRAGLEPSTMTGLLDRMEADALIVRCPDPEDRRAQQILLTPQAHDLREPVLHAVAQTLSEATEGMSSDELAATRQTLRRFLSNMHAAKREKG